MNNIIALHTPAPVAMPRGAEWAAAFFAATARAVHTLWDASADGPEGALGREAAEVRRFATEVSRTDPSFAADLFAAADRHVERGGSRG